MLKITYSFWNWVRTQVYAKEMKTSQSLSLRGFNLTREIITYKLFI